MSDEQFTKEVLAAEKSLYYAAWSILGNEADCADAMQNAILRAYGSLKSLRDEKYFKTWLTRILINECYSMARRNPKTLSYEDYEQEEKADETDGLGYSELYMEIRALDAKYRVPLVLHYVDGFTVKEIAKMLKSSEAGIKMRLLRARNILKKQLNFS